MSLESTKDVVIVLSLARFPTAFSHSCDMCCRSVAGGDNLDKYTTPFLPVRKESSGEIRREQN